MPLCHAYLRAAVFLLVADAGLEVCLEEGLAAAFLVAALVVVVLLSGDFFVLDAGFFEAGFFPVTSFLAASRREDEVVFFAEAALEVDFEEGFKAFLVAGSALGFAFVLEAAFAGLAATLSSLASFFTVVLFAVSLASLEAVSFLAAGFFVAADFVALEVVDLDPDLVAELAGAFLVEVDLEAFAGLFSLVSVSLFLATVFGGSLTRPERPLGR